jgi:hypothetical protein
MMSMSYDPRKALFCELLHGFQSNQQAFIYMQLKTFAALTSHPLLLPVMLVGYQLKVIASDTVPLYNYLLYAEASGGQGDLTLAEGTTVFQDGDNVRTLTRRFLKVIRFSAAYETYLKAVLLSCECLATEIQRVGCGASSSQKGRMEGISRILTERLFFVSHKLRVMLSDFRVGGQKGSLSNDCGKPVRQRY